MRAYDGSMQSTFQIDLTDVLKREGGFVNDPKDPGGATNHGVTQHEYDHWRAAHGLPSRSVVKIATDEIAAIYAEDYWQPIHGDALPAGVDYCVFDFAVNSGPTRAVKFLQRAVGVKDDGILGHATLDAVARHDARVTIESICDSRQEYLEHLPTFSHFGRGWTARVDQVRAAAEKLV